jgi:hypothetical protein
MGVGIPIGWMQRFTKDDETGFSPLKEKLTQPSMLRNVTANMAGGNTDPRKWHELSTASKQQVIVHKYTASAASVLWVNYCIILNYAVSSKWLILGKV